MCLILNMNDVIIIISANAVKMMFIRDTYLCTT